MYIITENKYLIQLFYNNVTKKYVLILLNHLKILKYSDNVKVYLLYSEI